MLDLGTAILHFPTSTAIIFELSQLGDLTATDRFSPIALSSRGEAKGNRKYGTILRITAASPAGKKIKEPQLHDRKRNTQSGNEKRKSTNHAVQIQKNLIIIYSI